MPALVIIYTILAFLAIRAKTEHGRKVASFTMILLSVFLIGLSLIGPNPGIVQE